MRIKVLIVEDEVLVAEDIADDLKKEGFEVTDIAISGEEALVSIEKDCPHIILMDINIKGDMDGIETAQKIVDEYKLPIIYVTSNTSSQFVNRALETSPHAFISKPYNVKDLIVAVELAFKKYNQKELSETDLRQYQAIFVKDGEYHKKIELKDIYYIEADGSYCNVYSKEQKYTLSFNLNHFQSNVQSSLLQRVHRSYVVNLNHVDGFDKNTLLIQKKIIPVSNSYKEETYKAFKKL
ncbi:MAG: response regulator [Crocinitomicaceae bacterium]